MKTEQFKIDSNIIIAEFMGYKFDTSNSQIIGYPTEKGFKYRLANFHISWDWLMPAVKKCWELLSNDDSCKELKGWRQVILRFKEGIAVATFNNDIDLSYSKVVEFIKWYNKNK